MGRGPTSFWGVREQVMRDQRAVEGLRNCRRAESAGWSGRPALSLTGCWTRPHEAT